MTTAFIPPAAANPWNRLRPLLASALLAFSLQTSGCGDYCQELCSPDAGLAKGGQCFCRTEDGEVYGPVGE